MGRIGISQLNFAHFDDPETLKFSALDPQRSNKRADVKKGRILGLASNLRRRNSRFLGKLTDASNNPFQVFEVYIPQYCIPYVYVYMHQSNLSQLDCSYFLLLA